MSGDRLIKRGDVQVSVVIPCRNAAGTVGEQLDALTRQSFRGPWEVVVVDDGSTDGTRAILDEYGDRLPLMVIDSGVGTHSPARARNLGARAARGDCILFCDADDVVDDGWGAALQRALEERALVCARRDVRRLNRQVDIDSNRRVPDGPINWWDGGFVPYTAGCVLGVRRGVHEAIGGFDERFVRLGEDFDYCWRVQIETGERLAAVPDAIVHYRFHAGLRRAGSGSSGTWSATWRRVSACGSSCCARTPSSLSRPAGGRPGPEGSAVVGPERSFGDGGALVVH